jgi:uncharacterized protein YdhG (YjbR/CyaY superfamily)
MKSWIASNKKLNKHVSINKGSNMNSSKKQIKTIDKYIASFPKDVKNKLIELRRTIKKAAPDVKEKISYNMPTFTLNGNLVYFAAFKNHIGFYPMPKAITEFKKELSTYKTSKGTIQFPLDKPLPLSLITKIVKFKVKENLSKNFK